MKLLIASALLLILSTVTVNGSAVYDNKGVPLKAGTYYYITYTLRSGLGGGLFPFRRLQPCAPHVWGCSYVVTHLHRKPGTPVTFYPLNSDDKIVQLDSDVKIEFKLTLPANATATWQLEKADGSTGRRYVTVGGKPTPDNAKNKRFSIEKVEDSVYKIIYCPTVPRTCVALGLTFDPQVGPVLCTSPNNTNFRTFLAVFVKAESSEAISLVTE